MKKPWKSKTLLANLLVAIVAFFGEKYVLRFSHEQILMVLAGLNMVLRLATKDKIGLEE